MFDIERSGTVEGLAGSIDRVLANCTGVQALLIMSCADNGFTPDQVDPILTNAGLPILGGVFPALIHDAERLERGSIVWGITSQIDVAVIENISAPEGDLEAAIDAAITTVPEKALQLIFVDGFARRIGALINAMHDVLGVGVLTIGGGAGSLDFVQRPCLLTQQGMLEDAAVVGTLSRTVGVGVSHGWQQVRGPFRVTESQQNTIVTLDWRPAFEVYREVVEAHSGKQFTEENFFDIAKAYPFGLARLDSERIIRDPVMIGDKGALDCVGEVPEGEHVDIMNGDEPSLLAAASKARAIAVQQLGAAPELTLFMDCISRVLFLGDSFSVELESVRSGDVPTLGACTIGELANHGGEFLEFYNKTAVVAALAP